MKERETLKIDKNGHLQIGGCDAVELAKTFGTPIFVMDEDYIRKTAKSFNDVLKERYGNGLVCYASKAFSSKAIYKICASEGLGVDVVSAGELFTALAGGIDAQKIYFHGNNKSPFELQKAVDANVGAIVVDSEYEIEILNDICVAENKCIDVLVRVNPGIDAHTHHYIQTTRVDSKFGFSISLGDAINAIKTILSKSNLNFKGIHCHIGSQIFEVEPFEIAVDKMTDFIVEIKNELNIDIEQLNMGGGYGVVYTDDDCPLLPSEYVEAIVNKLLECIEEKKIKKPFLILEPGRSIVGEAGITLYTIGAIKDIKGIKKYISVDGGMFENPRYALYEAKYQAVMAERACAQPTEHVTVAGKCCESGDIIIEDAYLPQAKSGEILAVLTTGAYNYSMSSNYNRNPVPPVVMVKNSKAEYIVKPQTYDDVMARDVLPSWLEEA